MERRHFLKVAIGFAAGAAAVAASASAAPLSPYPLNQQLPAANEAQPAVTSESEVEHLKPEQVRWHRRHWGWRRRHWGWRRRHWRRRYY